MKQKPAERLETEGSGAMAMAMAKEVRSERPGAEAAIYRATEAALKGDPMLTVMSRVWSIVCANWVRYLCHW